MTWIHCTCIVRCGVSVLPSITCYSSKPFWKDDTKRFGNCECPWIIFLDYENQTGSAAWRLIAYWIRSGTLSRPLVFGNLNP